MDGQGNGRPAPRMPGELALAAYAENGRRLQDQALVLKAKGIPHVLAPEGRGHGLFVPVERLAEASEELELYATENVDWPPKEETLPAAPYWIQGGIGYVVVTSLVYLLSSASAFGKNWGQAGAARSDAILAGEPWRAMTSLTLHTGPPHLFSNLIYGTLFGGLVAYTVGGGLGWLAILLAGFFGNLLNAVVHGAGHSAVGASTSVFGAVGILAGSEWRRRNLLRQGRLRRGAPILAALVFLSYLGVGGVRTDVMAHVTGLFTGLAIGALLPSILGRGGFGRGAQKASGAIALLLVALAWAIALTWPW